MGRAVPPPASPTLAQLEEMGRLKDRAALEMRDGIHQAWAMSWLAMQAFDAARTDYSAEKHHEATYIALECIVTKLEETRSLHDYDYSGVHYTVMNRKDDVT